MCPYASLEGSSTMAGCVHPNSLGWIVPSGGMVKGGGKIEFRERVGGVFELPTGPLSLAPYWHEEEIVPLFPKLIKLCCVILCSCLFY